MFIAIGGEIQASSSGSAFTHRSCSRRLTRTELEGEPP